MKLTLTCKKYIILWEKWIFSGTRTIAFIGLIFIATFPLFAADLKIHANGIAELNGKFYRCTLGKNGVTPLKTEGDLKTPIGRFPVRYLYYRRDKFPHGIHTKLTQKIITPYSGWCDDPNSIYYNQAVNLPFPGHTECLWRSDNLYDVILVIGYNDASIKKGKGSAVFIHVANKDYSRTQGCVAFSQKHLLEILSLVNKKSSVIILP